MIRKTWVDNPASTCKSQEMAQDHPSVLGLHKRWLCVLQTLFCQPAIRDCSKVLQVYNKGRMSRSRQENRLHTWTHVLPSTKVNARKPTMEDLHKPPCWWSHGVGSRPVPQGLHHSQHPDSYILHLLERWGDDGGGKTSQLVQPALDPSRHI